MKATSIPSLVPQGLIPYVHGWDNSNVLSCLHDWFRMPLSPIRTLIMMHGQTLVFAGASGRLKVQRICLNASLSPFLYLTLEYASWRARCAASVRVPLRDASGAMICVIMCQWFEGDFWLQSSSSTISTWCICLWLGIYPGRGTRRRLGDSTNTW